MEEIGMNNKGVGAVFCLIASILTAARYLSAAIFMSGVSSWNSELFQVGLSYTGSLLQWAAVVALIAGVAFLGMGLYQDFKNSEKK